MWISHRYYRRFRDVTRCVNDIFDVLHKFTPLRINIDMYTRKVFFDEKRKGIYIYCKVSNRNVFENGCIYICLQQKNSLRNIGSFFLYESKHRLYACHASIAAYFIVSVSSRHASRPVAVGVQMTFRLICPQFPSKPLGHIRQNGGKHLSQRLPFPPY